MKRKLFFFCFNFGNFSCAKRKIELSFVFWVRAPKNGFLGVDFVLLLFLFLPLPCTLLCCMFMRYAFFPRLTLTLAPNAHREAHLLWRTRATLCSLGATGSFSLSTRFAIVVCRPRGLCSCCCCWRCPPCCFILAHLRHNGISFRCLFSFWLLPLTFPLSRLDAIWCRPSFLVLLSLLFVLVVVVIFIVSALG